MASSVATCLDVENRKIRGSHRSDSPRTFAAGSFTPLQLCVALNQAQRSHSRLLDELEQSRELHRQGLEYREGISANRQFVDAYLARQQAKIERTIEQLKANRKRAHLLIELADIQEAGEAGASARFSSRLETRRNRDSIHPAGSDRVRNQVVSK